MMKHSHACFYLIPLLLVIHGFSNHVCASFVFQSRNDTAIINDWYREAFRSMDGNLKKSDDLINKAWKMSIDIAYDQGIADGYYYTGCVYEQKAALNIARRYFEKAVSLYTQGQFLAKLPDCYKRLGEIYMKEDRYYTALQHFLNGLRVADEEGDHVAQIELSIQLANYHNTVSRDYKEAIAMLSAAERRAKTANYPSALATIYLQYGMSYANQRDYVQALHYTQLARQAFDKLSNAEDLLKTLLVEGDIHSKTHEEDRLATVLSEAKPLINSVKSKQLQEAYQLLHATELYFLGDYNSALTICETLYAQLDGNKQQEEWREARSLHFKVLYALGDVRQADSLFDNYEYIKDSLYTAQYIGQGMEMSENYKLEKFERQIREQELQLSNTNYQRYGFIAGIVVLLTILIILYFHFREKDKLAHRVAIKNAEVSVQNEILKQANRQNEMLLREIHHRVKNNLQIINSLLNLQSRKTTNQEVMAMMQESSSRINSIALIHNKLYQQQSLNRLNIQEYIEQLGAHLLSIYNVGKKSVRFKVEANNVSLDIDTAIPIGLILTELMTNSLKYAFVDREEGEIYVHVKHEGEKDYELIFKDNGVGIPETKFAQTNETLGFRLINSLTRQLAGIIQYTFGEFSMYNIRFKGQA
ncbi:tetratricopeptide repeat-containing sensor histidine kinase [Parapedobacter koreensis]|uniref:histidine kinase n=1 Tax=Parapedobacter koreensis TaxID=332977 RepID=A0A1H7PEW4_9SPHI|nr:sensor histidine kinase [Parapedobacter koreensis]SEL34320.1 Two-component sensor histidine kinase, contains HisKA and HATPase domains [Parapedobacter koreensis]